MLARLRMRAPRIPPSSCLNARYSCTFAVQEWTLESKAGAVQQTSLRPDLPRLHAAAQGTLSMCSAAETDWNTPANMFLGSGMTRA